MTKGYKAFTIVELLVVIVVIGILAAITIVSYSGISNKAIIANLQNDLDSNAKLLKMYNVEYGYYPSSIDNTTYCPTSPNPDARYCLKAMNGATLTYSGGGQSFTLIDTHTTTKIAYKITENSSSALLSGAMSIAAGFEQTCAIMSDLNSYCWGYNGSGSVGDNSTTSRSIPTAVNKTGLLNGLTMKSINAVAQSNTCGIASDNNAYCWGAGGYGRLGNNSTANSLVPVAVYKNGVLNGLTIKAISSTGEDQTCVIASDDNAYCWGYNPHGELGNNSTANSTVPVAVDRSGVLNGLTVKAISTGFYHSCVIASDNNAYCWGYNPFGQLGNNSTANSSVPVAVDRSGVLNGLTIKTISAGDSHTCVIASDDNAYCWGYNGIGGLGNNSRTTTSVPVAVMKTGALNGLTIKSISAGLYNTCTIASDDNAYCWGENNYGVLGNNSTSDSNVAVAVNKSGLLNGLSVTSIAVGRYHACVIASDMNIYCWGKNKYGQLGNNSNTDSLQVVKVISPF